MTYITKHIQQSLWQNSFDTQQFQQLSTAALTNIKSADGERSCDQLIHHNFPHHRLDSAPRQHPLQPPQPVVVEVGVEAEADGRHSCRLTPVDASRLPRRRPRRVLPTQHILLYEVGGGKEGRVSQDVADVRVSPEHIPGPPHAGKPVGKAGRVQNLEEWIDI